MPAFRTGVIAAAAIFAASALSDDDSTCTGLECSTRSDRLVQTSFTRGTVLNEDLLAKAFARVVASRTPSGDEQASFLNAHNQYRCMHGADAVTWSDAMANDASSYISTKTSMQHSDSYGLSPPAGPAGENLFSASWAASPQEAVDMWYDEVHDCATGAQFTDGCAQPAAGKMTGHFTAMVWKGVKEIGCAFSDLKAGLIICRYKAGNSLSNDTPNMNRGAGNYKNHVFPASKTKAQCPSGQTSGSSTPGSTPAATPAPPSGGGATIDYEHCVLAGSRGQCATCTHTSQCENGFCCPFMKKCVPTSSTPCSSPIAYCQPPCHETDSGAKCECTASTFPTTWLGKSCGSSTSGSTPAATPVPTPGSTPAPPSGGGSTTSCVTVSGAGQCTVTTQCSARTTVVLTCASPTMWTGHTITAIMPGSFEWDLSSYCTNCSPLISVAHE